MQVDALIFGGGAAGLWLLDELLRRGDSAVLLEAGQFGQGQTIASQGIIHGGLKYTLQGLLTPSATGIRDMPGVWRDCLAGQRQPDLQATRLRSDCCHLWRTDSVRSRLGMIGARFGLRVAPNELPTEQRPEVLRRCPGNSAIAFDFHGRGRKRPTSSACGVTYRGHAKTSAAHGDVTR